MALCISSAAHLAPGWRGPLSGSRHLAAAAFAEELGAPLVVKASGLAAGKGVSVCATLDEARQAIEDMMVRDA